MSYRRSYTGHVHYSGTVSYPASEHGGSVSYSGSEPVYITIDVDTDAFDASVAHCNNSVGGLATAVVATEAAQVEAKKKASSKIADTIVKGFFDYVGADLSQKIKELASKCEALFVALIGHKDNCLAKSSQMQEDYNRITRRYSKIFGDLDKETVSRIEVLDKQVFQFADTAQKVIDRSADTDLLGISTISANENIMLETMLSCSHVKQQANILLDKANAYLQGTCRLANSVRDMLSESGEGENIMLPVMYSESMDPDKGTVSGIYGIGDGYEPSFKGIDSILLSDFRSKDVLWEDMASDDYGNVMSYLNSMVQADDMDERVLKTMLGLVNGHSIQTIKTK